MRLGQQLHHYHKLNYMFTTWDPRLKFGVIILLIGLVLQYAPLTFIPAGVQSAGSYFTRVGLFLCFWGIFRVLLRKKYSK